MNEKSAYRRVCTIFPQRKRATGNKNEYGRGTMAYMHKKDGEFCQCERILPVAGNLPEKGLRKCGVRA